MSYTTNRLKEALKKLADVDEAIGDLMRREESPTENLKAARNHTRAATALLEARHVEVLKDRPPDDEQEPCQQTA